jgi:hypothetical protein
MSQKLTLGARSAGSPLALSSSSKRRKVEPKRTPPFNILQKLPSGIREIIFRFSDSRSGAHLAYVYARITESHEESMKVMRLVFFKLKRGHDFKKAYGDSLQQTELGDSQNTIDTIAKENADALKRRAIALHEMAPSVRFLRPFSDLTSEEFVRIQQFPSLMRLNLSSCSSLSNAEMTAFVNSHPQVDVRLPFKTAIGHLIGFFDQYIGEDKEYQKHRNELAEVLSNDLTDLVSNWHASTYDTEYQSLKRSVEIFLKFMRSPLYTTEMKKTYLLKAMPLFQKGVHFERMFANFKALVLELERKYPLLATITNASELYFRVSELQEERRSNLRNIKAILKDQPRLLKGDLDEIDPQVELDLCEAFRKEADCNVKIKEARGEKVDFDEVDQLLQSHVGMSLTGMPKLDFEPLLSQQGLDFLLKFAGFNKS